MIYKSKRKKLIIIVNLYIYIIIIIIRNNNTVYYDDIVHTCAYHTSVNIILVYMYIHTRVLKHSQRQVGLLLTESPHSKVWVSYAGSWWYYPVLDNRHDSVL